MVPRLSELRALTDAELKAATTGKWNWLRLRIGVTIMGHRQMFAQMEAWHRRHTS